MMPPGGCFGTIFRYYFIMAVMGLNGQKKLSIMTPF